MPLTIARDSIHWRKWVVYAYRPQVSARVLVPVAKGFRTKREAIAYAISINGVF
jgi:hypothetical protein